MILEDRAMLSLHMPVTEFEH